MKNTPSTLSPRQQQLCQTIETLTASRGFPPSLREVAAEMGVHYTRVAQLAASVEARGALLHEPRVARSWRVVKPSAAGTVAAVASPNLCTRAMALEWLSSHEPRPAAAEL